MEVLQVKIISPQDVLYQDQALSVSSKNSSGKFDILPEHSDFITIIEKQPILIQPANSPAGKERVTFQFELAIIYTTNNIVTIFAKTASPTL